MVDLIQKKRDGYELSEKEIAYIINGLTNDEIPDYQISAWAMAVYFQGMSQSEQVALTEAIVSSGEQIDLSQIDGIKVDKHSTGGVGDTTTLVLAPLVASVGVPVAKMSGRGLGHTGGTIDKLESIPGFRAELSKDEFIRLVNENKLAVIGQTEQVTPADKKLYSLRDVTATVDSIPLIASSIMSKKIAGGADAIVLDVKTGSGAFMKDHDLAKQLAEAMVEIGNRVGKRTMAFISRMDGPLGYMIGNALEVKEAIETLKGNGPNDLLELCLELGSYMVYFANQAETIEGAKEKLQKALVSGRALQKFQTLIHSQGGDPSIIENPDQLPVATYQIPVPAKEEGYVSHIDAGKIGTAVMRLGAGRESKDASIDHAVGIQLKKKIGDHVNRDEPFVILHSNTQQVNEIISLMHSAYSISSQRADPQPLIYERIL